MPTAQQDTEITLGTGRMLVIFFALVLVCAFFFSIGFSLGRKTTLAGAGGLLSPRAGAPSTLVRPSAAKNDAPPPTAQSGDFSFYKAVGAKSADAALTPPESKTQPPASATATPSAEATKDTSDTAKIPQFRGLSPWILMDFRSPMRQLPGIQDGYNRKGLISNRGEKKEAFFVLQNTYRDWASHGTASGGPVQPTLGVGVCRPVYAL